MKLDYKLVIIGGLAAACVILYLRNQNLRSDVAGKSSIINEKNAEIAYRTSETGRIIAEKVTAEATAKHFAEAYPQLAEEIKKEFDIKLKDVKAYVRNEIRAQGKGEGSTVNNHYTDSTGVKRFSQELHVSDNYLRLDAVILDTNRFSYRYVYADTITTVISAKRKWFLGNEKLFATSSLRNKEAKVMGSTNILIKDHKDKRFVLSAGAYYDPFRQDYGFGVHFGYALIKF